jgi:hypothetical protein
MMVGINAYLYIKFDNNIQSITLKAGSEHEFTCVQGQNR